jgi:hypothetical protein
MRKLKIVEGVPGARQQILRLAGTMDRKSAEELIDYVDGLECNLGQIRSVWRGGPDTVDLQLGARSCQRI